MKQFFRFPTRSHHPLVASLAVGLVLMGCGKKSDTTPGTPTNPSNPTVESAVAFPGAEGAGKVTTGGRGGRVIKVTNLNDSGTGSLRSAIDASGARTVVFEVAGNIVLLSPLRLRNGDVTIAGQSAPGDGICLQNYELNVDADNVIIRYMRFRMGDLTRNEQDALWGRYHQKIVIDHCSMSWSIDECSSFYANKDFTMQYCILAESLNKSFHNKDDHGYGAIWGGANVTFHHNLLANHNSRNARFDGGKRTGTGNSPFGIDLVDYRNNVIYNWGSNSAYGGENGRYNLVNNYYKAGPATPSSKRRRIMQVSKEADVATYGPGYGTFYIEGNFVNGYPTTSADNWNGGVDVDAGVTLAQAKVTTPFANSPITQQPAERAYDYVLNYAGASLHRDAVDTRVVGEVRSGTNTFVGSKTGFLGLIDSQTDVGGWPTLATAPAPADADGDGMPDDWETARGLDPKKANAAAHDLSTGYDNLEVYLNSLVQTITEAQLK